MTRSICGQPIDRDTGYCLLLAKMVFRIEALKQEVAKLRNSATLVDESADRHKEPGDAASKPVPEIAPKNIPENIPATCAKNALVRFDTEESDMQKVHIPIKPTTALLRPFIDCPAEELELAWAAMILIASKMAPEKAVA
jgi:hypothetical protein